MGALNAVKLVRPRTSSVSDAVFKVSLHQSICARAMGTHRAMAFRTAQLPLSVFGERVIDGNQMPLLVGPELAIFDHAVMMRPACARAQPKCGPDPAIV